LRIRASAPTRICDCGGWTDTWFAQHGAVCSLAITPGLQVTLWDVPPDSQPLPVRLKLSNFNETIDIDPGATDWPRHPLLQAAIHRMGVPAGVAVEIEVHSAVPPGASTGTSAAVTVTLLAVLARLNERTYSPEALAYEAYEVEHTMLGRQCGIQDQLAAAVGGALFLSIEDFPHAEVERLTLKNGVRAALEANLALVYLGQSHESSAVHEMVIAAQERISGRSVQLEQLRNCALAARDALLTGDMAWYGQALTENTEAQRALHPDLIGQRAQAVIDLAERHDALGWKVNGAGGDGGSVAVLLPDAAAQQAFVGDLPAGTLSIDVELAEKGVQVVEG